ncbi:unnamed protein product [Soboliphyme baturini]|uniref:Neur_chan_LBD domain-containing protein n=1 Tax=Soboliphyme baturini TaxID=241478 RepID=A0A183I9H8_9BILA|nr:unnamed protein product [Soboliphyme baturini]
MDVGRRSAMAIYNLTTGNFLLVVLHFFVYLFTASPMDREVTLSAGSAMLGELMIDYDGHVRPNNTGDPVTVLVRINMIDAHWKADQLTVTFFLRMKWTDKRLKFKVFLYNKRFD